MSTNKEEKSVKNDCVEANLDDFVSSQPAMIDVINGFIEDVVDLRDKMREESIDAAGLVREIKEIDPIGERLIQQYTEEAVWKSIFTDKLTKIIEKYGKLPE